VNEIRKDGDSFPFIVTDIQGYVRDFDPQTGAVSIFPSSELIKTLRRLGKFVFFIKCDYDEAKAALRDLHSENDPELTPSDCAVMLHEMFGFRCVAITMGPGGCVVSVAVSEKFTVSVLPCEGRNAYHQNVSLYIPAYTPKRVLDETGSGDTFLACTFAELMLRIGTGKKEVHCDDIFAAVETASAATSYLVERNEPHIFASRETAKLIQEKSPRNKDFVYLYPLFLFFFSNRHFAVSSTTITTIWSTSLF
jgi:sugar/nucleoside kinase (ribokinase family)